MTMTKQLLFSILIPNYGINDNILRCFETVFNQDTNDLFEYEVIVCDQNDDKNFLTIESLIKSVGNKRLKLYRSEKSLIKARCLLVSKAVGKYIVFVDSDDYVSSNYLLSIYEAIKINDFPCLIIHPYYIVQEGKQERKVTLSEEIKRNFIDYYLYSDYLNSLVIKCFKKEFFNCDLVYDYDVVVGDDWVLSFQLFEKIKQIVFCDDVDGYYYCINNSSTTKRITMEIAEKQIRYRIPYLSYDKMTEFQWKLFSKTNIKNYCICSIQLIRNKIIDYNEFVSFSNSIRHLFFKEQKTAYFKKMTTREKMAFYLLKLRLYLFLYLLFKI